MKVVADIEKWLVEVFKGLPRLSKKSKTLVAQVLPWFALIIGGLQVLSLLGAWGVIREVQRREAFLSFLGASSGSDFSITVMYISFVLSVVSAVGLFAAYAPLRVRARRGWRLLFIVTIVNTLSGLLALFIYGQGIGVAALNVIVALLVFYLLIQVRDEYKKMPVKKQSSK